MTLEMLIIAIVRVAGSLPALRWPFFGGLLALAVDQSDLLIMNLVDLGGVDDYQTFDKYLDQVYLGVFLVIALRWRGAFRGVAVALYAWRFAGFVAFELTGERTLLLFFPNLFEVWYLLVAGLQHFRPQARVLTPVVVLPALVLFALKLAQEYALHDAKLLDSFTTVEAIEAVWGWLRG